MWIQLLPKGPLAQARDGRSFTFDVEEVMRNSILPIPVDLDHETQYLGGPAVAFIEEFDVRDGELWGRYEKPADSSLEETYKYSSPVVAFSEDGRAIEITGAALTNTPALRLKPVQAFSVHAHGELSQKFAALKADHDAAKAELVALKAAAIEAEVEAHCKGPSPKIYPYQVEGFKALAKHDIAAFRKIMEATPVIALNSTTVGQAPTANHSLADNPFLKQWGIKVPAQE